MSADIPITTKNILRYVMMKFEILLLFDILLSKNGMLMICFAPVSEIYFHLFTDGRDTLPNSGVKYIKKLQEKSAQWELL